MKIGSNEKCNAFDWNKSEMRVLSTLTSPAKIQSFLDTLEYSAESRYRSPRSVLATVRHIAMTGQFLQPWP